MDAVVLLDAEVTYSVGPDESVHCPMIRAAVGESGALLILDTGSTDHILTTTFARDAALSMSPAEPGTDHAGAFVQSWMIGGVDLSVEGVQLRLADVMAIEGPRQFDDWGVGGFLSPQRLHPGAAVLLDLRSGRLILVEAAGRSLEDWLERRFPDLEPIALERAPNESVAVRAAIEPFAPVVALLNTGTPDTEFARTALPALAGEADEVRGLGISGKRVEGSRLADQVVILGEARARVPTLFLRDDFPPQHGSGHIGMDVLRGTVVAISADESEPVRWLRSRQGP